MKPGKNYNAPKQCRVCYREYSCSSALYLHLRRNHKARRVDDGRYIVEVMPRENGGYKCEICGIMYPYKGALILHH